MEVATGKFSSDTVRELFKTIWEQEAAKSGAELAGGVAGDVASDVAKGEDNAKQGPSSSSKRPRPMQVNPEALDLSCELLELFVREAIHRSAEEAEAEGCFEIESSHLERILPKLLLDF